MSQPGQMKAEFVGIKYTVSYDVRRTSYTSYSRGDHYGMGGGEYQVTYWTGEVVVRDRETGELIAACKYGVNSDRSFGRSDEQIRDMCEVRDILPQMVEAYADYLGERIINAFRQNEGMNVPYIEMEKFPRSELVMHGLVADENDQQHMALA